MSIRGFSFIALMRLLLSLFAGMHYCGAYVRPIARADIRGGSSALNPSRTRTFLENHAAYERRTPNYELIIAIRLLRLPRARSRKPSKARGVVYRSLAAREPRET
jgi:hypothetical protein